MPTKLILRSSLCPGDIMTMTAAVESLHRTYPGEYLTDVRTSAIEIWQHNPRIFKVDDDDPDAEKFDLQYPSINRSNQEHLPFLSGYTEDLGRKIGRPLTLKVNRPCLYLSDEEKTWVDQVRHHVTGGRSVPFWLVNAGIKTITPRRRGRLSLTKKWLLAHAVASNGSRSVPKSMTTRNSKA